MKFLQWWGTLQGEIGVDFGADLDSFLDPLFSRFF